MVDMINFEIIETINSPEQEYLSIDHPSSENPFAYNAADYDIAQLNRLTPTGMPAHSIKLRVGSVIVLLSNLNTQKALCNGTRLIVRRLHQNLIEAETINGGIMIVELQLEFVVSVLIILTHVLMVLVLNVSNSRFV